MELWFYIRIGRKKGKTMPSKKTIEAFQKASLEQSAIWIE